MLFENLESVFGKTGFPKFWGIKTSLLGGFTMKKNIFSMLVAMVLCLFMMACSGGGGGDSASGGDGSAANDAVKPQDMHGGKIILDGNTQTVEFDIADGIIKGVIYDGDISLADVDSVNFNSDRVGWGEKSTAVAKFDVSGIVNLPNTANNDKGTWSLKLKSGKYAWFNLDKWTYVGKPFVRIGDAISYGGFTTASIDFTAPNKATINFGSNTISGRFVNNGVIINPADVFYVQWNSDRVGWNEANSLIHGALQLDANGNYFVVIEGMPNNDRGNFSAFLRNGTFVWLSLDNGWVFSSNAIVAEWQIEYKLL